MLRRNIIFSTFAFLLFFSPLAIADVKITAESGGDKPLVNYTPTTSSTLNLSGSRGETLNFLLKLQGSGRDRVKLYTFKSSDGRTGVQFPIRFYTLKTIKLTKPSYSGAARGTYYDPLLPYSNTNTLNVSGTQWIWGEIQIPKGTKPAQYIGRISFLNSNVSFKLTVWKMTMPNKPSLPLYGEISPISIQIGHYGSYTGYELKYLNMTLYKKYIEALREHRAYSMRSYDYAFLSNPVTYQGKKILNIFSNPNKTNSFQSIFLNNIPSGVYYDFASPQYGPAGYLKNLNELTKFKNYYQAMQNTVAVVNRSTNYPVTFMWDEPFMNAWQWKTRSEYSQQMNKVKQFGQKIKSWAPSVKRMVTAPCYSDLYGAVDIVASAPNYMLTGQNKGNGVKEGTIADCQKLQNKGIESWWYVSCMSHGCSEGDAADTTPDMVIERNSSYIRSIAWLQYKYKFTGFYYYNYVMAYENAAVGINPMENVYNFSGNGDGTLLYPGKPGINGLTAHQPITSIRLKQWRETSFDAEYLKWFSQLKVKPTEITNELKALVTSPKKWETSYQKYNNLRNKIGAYLNQKM